MVKAHENAIMRLSAAQLQLQSAKAAAANTLQQHMKALQSKLNSRYACCLQPRNSDTLPLADIQAKLTVTAA